MAQSFQRILGINFFTGDMAGLLQLCAEGHFIVVPAAPALADLPTNTAYRESVEKSDFAITDSAFMLLLWKLVTGQRLPRISGLKLVPARDGGEPRVAEPERPSRHAAGVLRRAHVSERPDLRSRHAELD